MLVSLARTLLSGFSTEAWPKIKEGLFTGIVIKFGALYSEFSTVGVNKELLDETDMWSKGMTAAKLCLKEYLRYTRTRYKHARLLEIMGYVVNLAAILEGASIRPSPTLRLLFAKTLLPALSHPR